MKRDLYPERFGIPTPEDMAINSAYMQRHFTRLRQQYEAGVLDVKQFISAAHYAAMDFLEGTQPKDVEAVVEGRGELRLAEDSDEA